MTDTIAGRRVLVVEDEYFIASDLGRALANSGAVVVGPVGDLDRGLRLAGDEALDAAVLDVNLNGRPSFAIADRLATRGVPFLFLTGFDEWALPDTRRDAVRIAKPFAMSAVIAAVRQLVAAVPA